MPPMSLPAATEGRASAVHWRAACFRAPTAVRWTGGDPRRRMTWRDVRYREISTITTACCNARGCRMWGGSRREGKPVTVALPSHGTFTWHTSKHYIFQVCYCTDSINHACSSSNPDLQCLPFYSSTLHRYRDSCSGCSAGPKYEGGPDMLICSLRRTADGHQRESALRIDTCDSRRFDNSDGKIVCLE